MVGKIQCFLAKLDRTKHNRDEVRNQDIAPSKGGTDKYQRQNDTGQRHLLQVLAYQSIGNFITQTKS